MGAILPSMGHGQAALEGLIETCLADEVVRKAHPGIGGELEAVLEELSEWPLWEEATNPLTGRMERISVDRELFAWGVYFLLGHADTAARVPPVIRRAAHRDFQPFLDLVVRMGLGLSEALSLGMSLTVIR